MGRRPGGWAVAAGTALAVFFFWYGVVRFVRMMDAREGTWLTTTGYCNCGACCGWEPDGSGCAVYSYGPMKGRPKDVGLTSSQTRARHGTIAADPKVFPAGTRIQVPLYGEGVVEDRGGAIKGDHIDLWFPTHEEAKRWGVRRLKCFVRERP